MLNIISDNVIADAGKVILEGNDITKMPKRSKKLPSVFKNPSMGTCSVMIF